MQDDFGDPGTLEVIGAALEATAAIAVTSPLGEASPSSILKIVGQVLPLVISFWTNVFLAEILEERTGFEIFCVLFILLFLWILIADAVRGLWASVDEGRAGWGATWVMLVDFISLILVLMTFQYGPTLVREEWALVGISTGELIAFAILFVLFFLPSYLYFLRICS